MPLVSFLQTVDAWDMNLFLFLNRALENPFFDRLMPFVTHKWNFVLPMAILYLYLLLTTGRRVRILLLSSLVLLLLAEGSATVFTSLFHRARPCRTLEHVRLLAGCTSSSSFPSHHAANVFVVASFFAYTYRWAVLPLSLLAFLVGYSRIYMGVHYPLGVLGGAVLGTGLGLLGGLLAGRIILRYERRVGGRRFRWFPIRAWGSECAGQDPVQGMSRPQATCWALALGAMGLLMSWDRQALGLVNSLGDYFGMGQAMRWLTFLGAGHFQVSFALLLLSSGSLLRVERLKRAGWYGVYAIALSSFISFGLKSLLGRARPVLGLSPSAFIGPTFSRQHDSFPSGHATVTFAVAAALSRVWPRAHWLFLLGAGVLSLSRLFTGSHFPSDVLAGALVGIVASSMVTEQALGKVIPSSRPIARLLANMAVAREAIGTLGARIGQKPVVGGAVLIMVLLYLNQARHLPFDTEEILLDLLGGTIVAIGCGLRTWARCRVPSGNGAIDLPGAGSLVIVLGFGIMLESWWAFVLICGAVAFAEAFAPRGLPESGEPERRPTGFLASLWQEVRVLGFCTLGVTTIEVSEYLHRMHLFK